MTLDQAKEAQLRIVQAAEELYRHAWAASDAERQAKAKWREATQYPMTILGEDERKTLMSRISNLEISKGFLETELRKHKDFGRLKDEAKTKVEAKWRDAERQVEDLLARLDSLEDPSRVERQWKGRVDELTAQNTTQAQAVQQLQEMNRRLREDLNSARGMATRNRKLWDAEKDKVQRILNAARDESAW